VVRTPGGPGGARGYGPGLDEEEVSRLLRLPLAGELPWEPGLLEAAERGVPPGARTSGVLARFCRDFWAQALSGGVSGGGVSV